MSPVLRLFFPSLSLSFCLSFCFYPAARAQSSSPVVKANSAQASMREGALFRSNAWTISPELKPDVWSVSLGKNERKRVSLITDIDSISFDIKFGDVRNFVVLLRGKDSAYTQIRTTPKPASFDARYIAAHNNRVIVEIPEVYELVNILIALTPRGIKDSDLVEHETDYYKSVMSHFESYKNEPAVRAVDSALTRSFWLYFYLKMDAYAFEFDKKGKIVRSSVYDRVSWGGENTLLPYVKLMEDFANKTDFRGFYKRNKAVYGKLVQYYKDSVDLPEMRRWLGKNFPKTSYNAIKVLFSPLVNGSQSANWFEDNNFKEAQAHVNFPFGVASDGKYSAKTGMLRAGNIVFTELNHAYINPEADRYASEIRAAFADLSFWENEHAAEGYGNPMSCFNEYMNWALVGLRYIDYAPQEEHKTLLDRLERFMTESKGFKKFKEFNGYLVELYKNRKSGESLAALYPRLVSWCAEAAKKR